MNDRHRDELLECLAVSHSQVVISAMCVSAMLDEFTPDARKRVIEKVSGMVEGSAPEVRQLWAKILPQPAASENKPSFTLIRGGVYTEHSG